MEERKTEPPSRTAIERDVAWNPNKSMRIVAATLPCRLPANTVPWR